MSQVATTPLPSDPVFADAEVLAGPVRRGNELHWDVRLQDGRRARFAQLCPEVASDAAVARRYVDDVRRVRELGEDAVAPILAWGGGGSTDDSGDAPWRLRAFIDGSSLETWLRDVAPDEPTTVRTKLAALCDRLHALHGAGIVVRDLHPSRVIEGPDAAITLVDLGLARTDILSTRTAASLLLEGSPYSAPELMARTAVDGRADLYSVGVMAFVALTGELPYGDDHALLRLGREAPRVSAIRPESGDSLDDLVASLLAEDPAERPATAALVADVLRGDSGLPGLIPAHARCQHCGAPLTLLQRLCLGCGRVAVQFTHAGPNLLGEDRWELVLRKAKEEPEFLGGLSQVSEELAEDKVPAFNFLVGDPRMYSKTEQERAIKLPATLFTDLSSDTAQALQQRYLERGVAAEIQRQGPTRMTWATSPALRRSMAIVAATTVGLFAFLWVMSAPVLFAVITGLIATVGAVVVYAIVHHRHTRRIEQWGDALMRLRTGPAALPASDPLVRRLSEALVEGTATDVRDVVGPLALRVQQAADRRVQLTGEHQELDRVLAPLTALVEEVVHRVSTLRTVDHDLAELDEGRIVRALAAAEARGEPQESREALLLALDRPRALEQRRATLMTELGEASDLVRRSVDMGLRVRDEDAEHHRRISMALHALGVGDDDVTDG